jgi:signal transduction histidine kinase/ligand-binding sensor domain-containing protein
MSQYTRDQWGPKQGFQGGIVYAIAETPDGYLWIGTHKGLVRFDGLNFNLINNESPNVFAAGPVLGLAADAAGNLWIRFQRAGMQRYRAGKFENVLSMFEVRETGVTAMCRGINGDVLLSTLVNGKVRYSGERFVSLAPTSTLPNFLVISMAETADGKVWMGSRDAGLFSLSEGRLSNVGWGTLDRKINCLLPTGDRELWIGTDSGVVRWNGTELTRDGVPRALHRIQALAMSTDRESNIWVGTASGLARINTRGILSSEIRGEEVTTLYKDREGDLWVGSAQGIERFRENVFVTYSGMEGSISENNGQLLVDAEERTWFASPNGGLFWRRGQHVERINSSGLDKDVVYSIAGGNEGLWIGRQRGGLTHLNFKGGSLMARTFTQADGLAQNGVFAVHQSRDGTVWAGTLNGGVSSFRNGSFTNYSSVNGLVSNTVVGIAESSNGTMWFATPNGLSSLSKGHWRSYTSRDGLPPGNVNCLLEDSKNVLWIGTEKGIAFLAADQVKVPRIAPESLREQIFGVAEDRGGWLWIATSSHVMRVNRDKLLSGSLNDEDVREYGPTDGLPGTEGVKRHRSVVTDPLGRIWFSLNGGLSVVDPARLTGSSTPAIAHIHSITVDGSPLDLQSTVRIPAPPHRLTFGYSGVSLSVPERVRFRYRLDGVDREWSQPVATQDAIYTNLGPGSYHFRVIASNSEGLWNGAEASLGFEIEPVFWQTWWFRLTGGMACVLAILAFYRLRLHQLTRQMNLRFEARLAERTRIAQELHDTLLQGVLSASMRLHVAVDRLPDDSPTKPSFSRILQLMGQVVDQGRDAIRGIRSLDVNLVDLEQAFSRIPQELAFNQDNEKPIDFRVLVKGEPRALRPILRDEAYSIGREALVNAFRHSEARSIEVELEYAPSHLRILIRDDGCGIDPQALRLGSDGHWGLSGMRERAERIGAKLKVGSSVASGTEVELSVPGYSAFESGAKSRWTGWLAGLYRRRTGPEYKIEATKEEK